MQKMIATSVPLISLGGRTTPAGGWLTSSSPGVGFWAVDMAAGLIANSWGGVYQRGVGCPYVSQNGKGNAKGAKTLRKARLGQHGVDVFQPDYM